MNPAVQAIRTMVENAGQDPRRAVRAATTFAVEHSLVQEVLRDVEASNTLGSRWLRAALTEKIAGPEAAIDLWSQVVGSNGCEIPEILLHRARTMTRSGDTEDAAGLIRLALQNSRDYDLYIRAETLASKCWQGFGCKRKIKIALLGSSTTTLLRSVIRLLLLRDAVDAEFHEPPFGTYAQELLSADSALRRFQPDFIILLLNWRDLGFAGLASDAEVAAASARIEKLWKAALNWPSGHILQLTFTPPLCDPAYELSSLQVQGRARSIRRVNERLYSAANDRVTLIDAERIAARWSGAWEEPLLWSSAKMYPAPPLLPTIGEHLVSCIRTELGLSRKLLILDLDNTLWGGVIGEDGLSGIKLGPPSAIGERFQEFQAYVKSLRQRGVLLALASKNNPADAEEVFRRHPNCTLHLDDFVSRKIDWNDKASNIRRIASDLRLGLDSFVFLDDNPAERSSVRRELPEVIVPEISNDPADSISALERGLYFQALRITEEDRARSASYFAESKRAELAGSIGSVDEYLAELSMQLEYGSVDQETSVRVAQLINKTNQFNLTTRRYSLEEVQSMMQSPDNWCRWYRLKDRFADHGLIGVLIARVAGRLWTVDTWLMSCRVIGREVETFMLRDMVQSARESGADRITAQYLPTAKNALVAQLLTHLGFEQLDQDGHFGLDIATVSLPKCTFLNTLHRGLESQSEGHHS